MGLDVEDVVRNASGLLRTLDSPMDGVYALFGLMTLRLEDRHLDVESWPSNAHWETIHDADDPELAIRDAVHALQENQHTSSLGHSLEEIGLVEVSDLTRARDQSGNRTSLERDIVDFVSQTDITDFTPRELADLTDRLLFVAGDMSRSEEHFTPSSLVELIARLLDEHAPDNAEIYDPTTGSGSLLLALHRWLIRGSSGNDLRIYGQEINSKVAAVARINARLHGIQADIRAGDTLANPQHLDGDSVRTFDVVVGNPPMGIRADSLDAIAEHSFDRFNFGPLGPRLDSAFLQHAVSSLSETGCGALMMTPRLLKSRRKEQEVMHGLLRADVIETVLQLPSGILPYTSVPPALFMLNRSKPESRQGKVLLVDAREECEQHRRHTAIKKHHREKLASIIQNAVEVEGLTIDVSVEEILENECDLSPHRYVLDRDIKGFLKGYVEWKPLQQMATIESGKPVATKESGPVAVLTNWELSSLPSNPSQLQSHVSKSDAEGLPILKEHDLVLSSTSSSRIVEIRKDLAGVRCGQDLIRIAVSPEHRELSSFLVAFFNSSLGDQLLNSRSRGSSRRYLYEQELRELPIPVPGADVINLTKEVRSLQKDLESQISKVSQLQSELFELRSNEDETGKVIRGLTADTEVLSSSLQRTEDLDYRIRNFYPFPLAYTYRSLQSIGEPAQQHEEILRIVENVVAFMAGVGLSTARYEGLVPNPESPNLHEEELKDAWRGGIALGTWETLARATAKELRGNSKTSLGTDYASIWVSGSGQSELGKCIDELVEIRNDASHGRGPKTQIEYEEEVERLSERLKTVYEEIGFFVNYPLHYVRDLDAPWNAGGFEVDSLAYVGDHPGMNSETSRISHPVAQGVLYIESGDDEWIPLHPVISVQHCPQCKRQETYVLDKWTGEEKYSLKSFERGHGITAADTDIGQHIADFFAGR